MNIEKRFSTELRAKGRRLEGYAAVFGVEARISDFTEIIRPGAFKSSLAGDVLALVDHAPAKVLGRTRSGTLRLAEDTRGLHFELALPDTSAGHDVLALAERGDLGGMSFGFSVPDNGQRWQDDLRELVRVNLHEISVVSSWPAYEGTTVTARAAHLVMPVRRSLARKYLETYK
ncbi:MAG: HK97 family phage prohead protease [Solidesulfovibrio sp.]